MTYILGLLAKQRENNSGKLLNKPIENHLMNSKFDVKLEDTGELKLIRNQNETKKTFAVVGERRVVTAYMYFTSQRSLKSELEIKGTSLPSYSSTDLVTITIDCFSCKQFAPKAWTATSLEIPKGVDIKRVANNST